MFRLYVIADWETAGSADEYTTFLRVLTPAARRHVLGDAPAAPMLQVRAKGLSRDARGAFIATAKKALGDWSLFTVLNGARTPLIARREGFVGTHWPEAMIPANPLGPRSSGYAGASVHNVFALRKAEQAGASFVVFGPVFDAGSKPAPGVGLDRLREVTSLARVPVFAVGGIRPPDVATCIAAGAYGVAVITGIMRASNPVAAMDTYLDALEAAPAPAALPRTGGRSCEQDEAPPSPT